mgnify:CR=1 FL=1
MATFRIVGISFDHMHMGDLLRMVHEHPEAEIAGIFDPDRARMADAIATFEVDGQTFYATANEGDSRDFDESRVEELDLDPAAFPLSTGPATDGE